MIDAHPHPEQWMSWLGGLSDASRLRLLRLLEAEELGVAELCEVMQLPQSTVSRHLKVLSQQGWVVSRRAGTTNLYRVVLDELDPRARDLWRLTRDQATDWATARQDDARLERYLATRSRDSKAFFAGLAGEWSQTRAALYGKTFNLDALAALLPPAWTVADLGCGTGQLAAPLARHVRQVIGVDHSPEMLEAARRHAQPNLDLREGDLTNLPIDDAACDAALLVLVLTYVDQPRLVLQEARRILKPHGQLIVIDLLKHDREDFRRHMGQRSMGYAEAELSDRLTEVGFARPRVSLLPPEQGVQGPALLLARATPHMPTAASF